MTARRGLSTLLLELGTAGVELAQHPTDPAKVRHRPASLGFELAAKLRLHAVAVRGVLARGDPQDAQGEAGYVFFERLGIADELGMPTHLGAPAWLIAAGESLAVGCQVTTNALQCSHGATSTRHH